ncbi:MAG: hypothetical protein HY290_14260 [Planctomycetia bacterium]|nr:hypothetical protein [Planctomycetia bacterium]
MPDKSEHADDAVMNLGAVQGDFGRMPMIGPCSDRELFLDMPAAGWGGTPVAIEPEPIEREFLLHDSRP